MKKITIYSLVLLLWAGIGRGEPLEFVTIDNSLVVDKLMPAGTVVKIKVQQIPKQFNTSISLDCFPESVFTPGRPGNVGYSLKRWAAVDMLVGDVLSYTTPRRCFIGYSASPEYRVFHLGSRHDGYRRIRMRDWYDHQWVIDVRFPDYNY
ncbi:MAG: hypothetical protein R6W72_08125 [Desulfurivibrionaceae bacterium]